MQYFTFDTAIATPCRPVMSACPVHLPASDRMDRLFLGDVSERPKEHAWKACVVQATAGSNPAVTAKHEKSLRASGGSFRVYRALGFGEARAQRAPESRRHRHTRKEPPRQRGLFSCVSRLSGLSVRRRSARRRSDRRARPGVASSRVARRRPRLRRCSDRCPDAAPALRVGSARRTASA
jgi:hypothetical protein